MTLARYSADALEFERVRALFERLAPSSLGRRALRELAPTEDEAPARVRLERLAAAQELAQRGVTPPLGGLSDPLPMLAGARRYSRALADEELAALLAFLGACTNLRPWLHERRVEAPALAALHDALPDLKTLFERTDKVVDERGAVRSEASPRLARLRREAREVTERVEQRLKRVLQNERVRTYLSDYAIHLRGGRRVLAVKAHHSGRVPGLLHDRSQTGETAFIEPESVLEDSNRLAEIELEAANETQRVLTELSREILEREADLQAAAATLAELELAVIGVAFCREYAARVPLIEESGELVLRAARHPLLVEEQRRGALSEVVPIDVRLGGDFDLLVITGPNTGGKTLALKTVGLAALCARLGLPVLCAEQSRVPFYDGIAADIGDEQEISQSLSTFSSHLSRIRAGLERATPRTLALLDELGGGTDPDEGAALSDALLEHLLARRVPTIATTHLGKLKEFAFRHARAENGSVEFDAETLMPLYRLMIGTPGESNALAIARRLGLDPSIVARAEERLVRHGQEVAALMAQVRGAREQAERVRVETEARLVDVARTEASLAEQGRDLALRREFVEAEAQRGLEERVREARRRIAALRTTCARLPGEEGRALEQALDEIDGELVGASLTERRQAFLASLAKDRFVWVPRYRQRGVVVKVDRARQRVSVRVGKVVMEVPFDELTWYEAL